MGGTIAPRLLRCYDLQTRMKFGREVNLPRDQTMAANI